MDVDEERKVIPARGVIDAGRELSVRPRHQDVAHRVERDSRTLRAADLFHRATGSQHAKPFVGLDPSAAKQSTRT
ncbi:hypothetical protein GCM10009576_098580 [Streptomyces rhizosphaericus]|uniref:Uncharacterized protein n=1 Tax=Streptomyces rhizosphaericus TaxID=114699 RepID=A0ABN1SV74_9ACTN